MQTDTLFVSLDDIARKKRMLQSMAKAAHPDLEWCDPMYTVESDVNKIIIWFNYPIGGGKMTTGCRYARLSDDG